MAWHSLNDWTAFLLLPYSSMGPHLDFVQHRRPLSSLHDYNSSNHLTCPLRVMYSKVSPIASSWEVALLRNWVRSWEVCLHKYEAIYYKGKAGEQCPPEYEKIHIYESIVMKPIVLCNTKQYGQICTTPACSVSQVTINHMTTQQGLTSCYPQEITLGIIRNKSLYFINSIVCSILF